MDDAADHALWEAAAAVRPYLPDLLGPAAEAFEVRLVGLFEAPRRSVEQVSAIEGQLGALFDSEAATSAFLEAVRDDDLRRPPEVQEERLRNDYSVPAGAPVPPPPPRYHCPRGDYVWYRLDVSLAVPACPTHGQPLVSG